ncbi:hypothetical protein [Mycolicibacterium rhodesiae]|uniref:Transmembrane protein n=1 Tax=Mycolicibacterium rhodesiae TaxID=36814 RepID=A0A1X0IVX7_MYCRH|nr:hypothetical protein [Mycolicibacterium rhodesiae]MCV7346056.1 hypothetical protein [Mycolicibacterium rhodesiae]ORB52346.1 hypothetical protein BST42_15445 [Mycolicibacterium rhodesiae]
MTAAAWLFGVGGAFLVGIGAFFMLARPALLPEDLRYLDRSAVEVATALPRLGRWLRCVFTVLGGYAAATGILTLYLAVTSVREGNLVTVAVLAIAGAPSIGVMAVVNLLLHSAFRFALPALAAVWVAATLVAVAS